MIPASVQANRSQNTMTIVASDVEGNSMDISFDVFGNLGEVRYYPMFGESYYSHRNFSGHYLTFSLIELDEVNKTVKIEFSGRLYEEDDNLDSPFKEVSGGFWVNYTEVTPAIPDLEVSAEIAGNDWYSTNWYTSNGLGSFSTFIHHHFSDDEYKIMLGFDDEDMSAGTYQFTPLTDLKFARLAKYDIQTKQYVVYNCTGTIEITSNENAGMFSIVSGNYSFTAVHPSNPSETIQVSNGSFKTNYSW